MTCNMLTKLVNIFKQEQTCINFKHGSWIRRIAMYSAVNKMCNCAYHVMIILPIIEQAWANRTLEVRVHAEISEVIHCVGFKWSALLSVSLVSQDANKPTSCLSLVFVARWMKHYPYFFAHYTLPQTIVHTIQLLLAFVAHVCLATGF